MRSRHLVSLSSSLLLALLLVSSMPMPAHADETAAFVMTNTHTNERAIGVGLALGRHSDATLVGLEGTLRWPIGDRWALGARLPLVFARNDLSDDVSLGNLTFSGTVLLSGRHRSISALDLSVSAPTAGGTQDDIDAGRRFAAFYVPDRGLYRPNTTTVRVHYSLRSQGTNYFGQLEFGLHQLIIDGADDQTWLRLGMAVGVHVSRHMLLVAELTNMSDILDDTDGEDFWHTLDFGLRARTGRGHLGLRVYLPLDRSLRNQDIAGVLIGYERFL